MSLPGGQGGRDARGRARTPLLALGRLPRHPETGWGLLNLPLAWRTPLHLVQSSSEIYLFRFRKMTGKKHTVHRFQQDSAILQAFLTNLYCFLPLLERYRETYIFMLAFPPWTCLNSHMGRYKTGGFQLFMEQSVVSNATQICKYSCWGNNFLNLCFEIKLFIPTAHIKFYFTINLSEDLFNFFSFHFLSIFISLERCFFCRWRN